MKEDDDILFALFALLCVFGFLICIALVFFGYLAYKKTNKKLTKKQIKSENFDFKNVIKRISKISVFSLIGIAFNFYLIYTFLSLWLHPQTSDIGFIYSLTILIFFEILLISSGFIMSAIGRDWKAWIVFILIYGLFTIGFSSLVNEKIIIIIYCSVVLNRMLSGMLDSGQKEKDEKLKMAEINFAVWFLLIIAVNVFSFFIPKLGLSESFMTSVDYPYLKRRWNFFDSHHIYMCFGVLYYLILTIIDMILIFRSTKKMEKQLMD
jgi:MFS family permease